MIPLIPTILLAASVALAPAAAAERDRAAATGHPRTISGHIELFPDGRVVRAPGAAPAPRPADDGTGGPPAPQPAGFIEPRFPAIRR